MEWFVFYLLIINYSKLMKMVIFKDQRGQDYC